MASSPGRGTWGSRSGFILAAAGSAVGLGNIWGFPTRVGQGGGAVFVLVYLACVLFICFPIMIAELALGRRAQKDPVGSFLAHQAGHGLVAGGGARRPHRRGHSLLLRRHRRLGGRLYLVRRHRGGQRQPRRGWGVLCRLHRQRAPQQRLDARRVGHHGRRAHGRCPIGHRARDEGHDADAARAARDPGGAGRDAARGRGGTRRIT